MSIVVGQDEVVGPWVMQRTGGTWNGEVTIGLTNQSHELVAGVLYDNFNGVNINLAVAAEGKHWLNREFLWFCFYYPFEQLRVERITCLVADRNEKSKRFCNHVGFVHEATLEKAHPLGDLLVFKMFKQDCKWLTLKGKQHGQKQQQS